MNHSLEDDLLMLAAAHGQTALLHAFARLQGTIRAARRAAARTWGPLSTTVMETLRISEAQKADEMSQVEHDAGLEHTLRLVWPQTRAWKFLCVTCSDYGLVMAGCPGDDTCGRDKAHLPHEFGRPCGCSRGARHRETPKPTADDFTSAGQSKSRMTRVGRR